MLRTASSAVAAGAGGGFWLPRQGSALAGEIDAVWGLVYWLSVFFFVLITTLTLFFTLRYRRRPGREMQASAAHNTPLEVFWTVVPIGIVAVLFWRGYTTFLDQVTPPTGAYQIQVTGQKWNWLFTYPNGYVDGTLHVPVERPTELVMSSQDVIHSFFVPDFRVKRDVMPGRYSHVWFQPNAPGEHDVFCAEYCGTNHSTMLTKVIVHPPGEFDSWLAEASDFLKRMPPAEAGAQLYQQRGCKQCHSVNGTPGIGPTFSGLFGRTEHFVDGGSLQAEENYIRESILQPQARVVAGFEPVMPTFQGRLKDEEIAAIIEYVKTLSDGGAQ